MNTPTPPKDGVQIPQSAAEASKNNRRRQRSIHQLPVYRAVVKLKSSVVGLYINPPRKLTRYFDSILQTVTEAKKGIGMAALTNVPEEKVRCLTVARMLLEDVFDDVSILQQHGVISKELRDKMQSEARSVISQCVAWMVATNDQGLCNNNEHQG